jgi:apolipoprotein N-acyltransferase
MISAIAPQFEDTVLTHDVLLVSGKTPYREFGNFPAYAFFLILFGVGALLQRKIKIV